MNTTEKLKKLASFLQEKERLEHAVKILNYDMETASPEGGIADDGKDIVMLEDRIFKIEKDPEYISLVKDLHTEEDHLDPYHKRLIHNLYRQVRINESIDIKTNREANELYSQAYGIWLKAKKDSSYEEFKPTLLAIYKMQMKLLSLRYDYDSKDPYTTLFSDYEEGFTSKDLDCFFKTLEDGLVPLYKKVRNAGYIPRHDFLSRRVPINKQERFTRELLGHNGFDFRRGSIATTEHPFTEQFGENDVRITTKYFETNFISNMYSVIHEGGHALFGQNLPKEVFSSHLGDGALTMAKHESVSRFYENVLGRSKNYIAGIYPEFLKLFKEELGDISVDDFYEGVNYIDPKNPLRTEADELTYSLHIIIRYKLERKIIAGEADFDTLNKEWNNLYQKYLGLDIASDKEGILQDVHWASGFGYFPTYSLGNALNAMYVKPLEKEVDLSSPYTDEKMEEILAWMKEHVFKKAALLDTKEWIREITGEDFSGQAYVDYLKEKYTKIYHLEEEK